MIEVLSRAEASGRLSPAGWRELREEVLERPPSAGGMSRRLDERFGAPPPPAPPGERARLARLAALARRLSEGCRAERAVPRALAQRAPDLAREIEAPSGGEAT